jgi:hypothetical protein
MGVSHVKAKRERQHRTEKKKEIIDMREDALVARSVREHETEQKKQTTTKREQKRNTRVIKLL